MDKLHCGEKFDLSAIMKSSRKKLVTKPKTHKTWRLSDMDKVLQERIDHVTQIYRKTEEPFSMYVEDELLNLVEMQEWIDWMREGNKKKKIFRIFKTV